MKRFSFFLLLVLALYLCLAGCKPTEKKLYVATINDMHANIDNFPQLADLLDSLRSVHPDLLLFSAGDNRSGNPFNDRYAEPSRPMIELMNKVGFDLCELGNHEWDNGAKGLRDMVEWADFPFICANVTFDDSLAIPVKPYAIFEQNGLKIGVIGGIQVGLNGLPDFHPKNAGGSHFKPITEVIPQYLGLRDECHALFLISHCGFEEDVELAEQFPQFDAIFGGHSHTLVDSLRIFNGVLVTQAMNKIKYLTFSTFTFDKKGKMVGKESVVLPVGTRKTRNAEVQAMVDGYNNNEVFQTVLGHNDEAIVDCRECLGDLMADAHRAAAGAELGFQNYGGVRFDTLGARPILLKDLYSLDPFDNEIVSMNMTGREILDFLAISAFTDRGPNFCSGCSYSFSMDDEGQMKDCVVTLDNGKPLKLEKQYKVAMNSYMVSAFRFDHEDQGETVNVGSNEAMIEFLAAHPHINYASVSRVHEVP